MDNFFLTLIFGFIQWITILVLSPFVVGFMTGVRQLFCKQTPCRFFQPFSQPYRNLNKLWKKKNQSAQDNKWLKSYGPLASLVAIILAASMIPLFSVKTVGSLFWGDDLFLFFGLLLLSKFIQSMISLDAPSCFSGMGTARVMLVHSITEPVFFLIILGLGLNANSTSISEILTTISFKDTIIVQFPLIIIMLSLLLNILMECGRIPFDNPLTHLELTMIEKGARIERSGIDLAFAEFSEMLKMTILFLLVSSLICSFAGKPGTILSFIFAFKEIFNNLFFLMNSVIFFFLIFLIQFFIELFWPRYRVGDLPNKAAIAKGLTFFALITMIITMVK